MSFYDDASLIMYPSGYKEDKIYSLKPTDGSGDLTFTRASSATRVNSEGLIETSPVNLLQQSNTFNTTWTLLAASVTGGQTGYDGSTNAWLLENNSGTTTTTRLQQFIPGSSSLYTFSVYAKAGSTNIMRILIYDGAISGQSYFNFTTGTFSNTSSLVSTFAESVGGGWYRVSITKEGVLDSFALYPVATAGSSLSAAGDNIYIQDAQLVSGSTAKPYFPTTDRLNVPRIDYTGGGCGKLLLEPQRTNLVTQSEAFDNSAWTKTNATATDNSISSPDGTINATLLNDGALNNRHGIFVGIGSSGINTFSVFVKNKDRGFAAINISDSSGSVYYQAVFDLTTGNSTQQNTNGAPTNTSYSSTYYGNGWWRVSVTADVSTLAYATISMSETGTFTPIAYGYNSYQGSNKGIYIYGAQLEQGSYATSIINTSGAAATRVADASATTGLSDVIGQSEGTMFVDVDFIDIGSVQVLLSVHDGASNKRLEIWANGLVVNGFIGGSVNIAIGNTTISEGRHKLAVAYNQSGDQAFYVDGVQVGTSSTAYTIAALTQLSYNTFNGSLAANGSVNQAQLYKTRLSNAELATLTTL